MGAGLVLPVGELLLDLTSPFALLDASILIGGLATHAVAVPNDLTLIGSSIATQALLNQSPSGRGQLTNALILTFGVY